MKTLSIILINLALNISRYFVFAGGAFLIFYVLKRNKWLKRKIQEKYPDKKQLTTELKNSIRSMLIFSFVGLIFFGLNKMGYLKVYKDIHLYGIPYFFFSIAILIFSHDTYFYWSHRILHHPKLIKFHLEHHKSHNTTPFTSFSFHPIEAIVQTGFLYILLVIPVHFLAVFIFMFWQMFFNVIGHLGFEIVPYRMHNTRIGKFFNTVTHHNMHHRFTNQNFGLYFNFWDKIMSTNHKNYEKNYIENTNKMYPKLN